MPRGERVGGAAYNGGTRGGGHARRGREGPMALGIVLVIIGAIFLLEPLGITTLGFRELWPLVLIAVGLMILYERVRRQLRRR